MSALYFTQVGSPVGQLTLVSNGPQLTALYMENWSGSRGPKPGWTRNDSLSLFGQVRAELAAYFAGRLTKFESPILLEGTAFQERVWRALSTIPYGMTTSYGAIAASLGDPGAARTVGYTNGQNRLAIIVPCHRVVAANGDLTGYAGGLERKRWLLDHEAGRQSLAL